MFKSIAVLLALATVACAQDQPEFNNHHSGAAKVQFVGGGVQDIIDITHGRDEDKYYFTLATETEPITVSIWLDLDAHKAVLSASDGDRERCMGGDVGDPAPFFEGMAKIRTGEACGVDSEKTCDIWGLDDPRGSPVEIAIDDAYDLARLVHIDVEGPDGQTLRIQWTFWDDVSGDPADYVPTCTPEEIRRGKIVSAPEYLLEVFEFVGYLIAKV